MNNFFLSFFVSLLLCSYSLQASLSGIPGEIIAIKLNSNEELNSYLTIEKDGHFYALVPMPFDKQGESIKFQSENIFVAEKNFGESRITIENSSMVNLSKEDSERVFKESRLISNALKTYSQMYKSKLDFLKPVDGVISSRYGKKRFINELPRSPHLALDIAAPTGTTIIAPAYGKVILTGNFFYSGNYLILDHGYGLLTSYSHLSVIEVSEGQIVKQGQKIGEVGATGRVTGPHLHWTVYLNGTRINPESIIKENFLESIF